MPSPSKQEPAARHQPARLANGPGHHGSVQPEPEQPDTRNPAAVALSKLGASKGGEARAKSLNEAKRIAIAKKPLKPLARLVVVVLLVFLRCRWVIRRQELLLHIGRGIERQFRHMAAASVVLFHD